MERLLSIFLLSLTFAVCTANELVITHKPSYVTLAGKVDELPLSDVQHVISAIHGFTLHKELHFKSLYASSPFQHPKATAVVAVYGGDDFTKQLKQPRIPLKVDEVYVASHSIRHHLEQFYKKLSNVVEIDHHSQVNDFDGILEGMSDDEQAIQRAVGSVFKLNLLNTTEPEIHQLLKQVSFVLQSLDKVAKAGSGIGDYFSFELFMPTTDSAAVNEEISALLNAFIDKVSTKLTSLYGDDYVMFVVSLPAANVPKTRKSRSLLATEEDNKIPDADQINLATAWTADYPVIFHIVLWLVVFMALLVIFVTHAMMTMDPGNDSIIYRMTTTKLKKDN